MIIPATMWLVIQGESVMLWAIESVRHDPACRCVVVRTVSGATHRYPCTSHIEADRLISLIRERAALAGMTARGDARPAPRSAGRLP